MIYWSTDQSAFALASVHDCMGLGVIADSQADTAGLLFLDWVAAGKPRVGALFDQMKYYKNQFKYAVMRLKRQSEQYRLEIIYDRLANGPSSDFW